MNREEAEKLLRGGPKGIKEWNRLREEGEEVSSLYRIDLSRTDLRMADLRGVNLYGANICRSDLSETNLNAANLYGANIHNANLSRADLSEANLFGADLRGADLTGADLSNVNVYGAKLDENHKKYLSRFGITPNETAYRDIEAELKIAREEASELDIMLGDLGRDVPREEHEKVKKARDEAQAREKKLEEENKRIKAEQEITGEKIERAIESLESPNKYIRWEKCLHNSLFWLFSILAILCLVYVCCSFYKSSTEDKVKQENNTANVDNKQTNQISGFEMIKFFAPRVLAVSLFGVFLTQANRRRRSVQELQERKRAVETLRGVFLAINILSDSTSGAKKRINEILDKLAKQALELGRDGASRPTKADHESDHVEILKELKELKDSQKDVSMIIGKKL